MTNPEDDLTPDELEEMTAFLTVDANRHESLAGLGPFHVRWADGEWRVEGNDGKEKVATTWPRNVRADWLKERAKIKKASRQKQMILACRAAMTDDEFTAWLTETLPLLLR